MAITVGGQARFKGYTELEEGQEELLTAGEVVEVLAQDPDDGSFTVRSVANPDRADNVFDDELDEVAVAAEEAPKRRTRAAAAPAPVAEPAAAPVAAKGKGKAKPAVTAAPAAEPVAVLPTAKGKPKAKPAAAAKPAPAPKPVKEAPKMVVIETIKDMVGTAETALASAKQIAQTLNDLREQEEQTVFSLGGLLVYIRDNEAYKIEGYADMPAYLEAELGMKERSGQYYMRLYSELTDAGVTVKQIEGIGWTKLRALLGSINADNKVQLLAKAKKMTRDELVDHMKEVKAKVGKSSATDENASKMTKFPAFKLFSDQASAFEAAVNAAKTAYNVDNMAEALFYAMNDWSQDHNVDLPLEAALAALNARYGTDFSLDDNADEEADDEQSQAA